MIVVDASAILAILFGEPEAREFAICLSDAGGAFMSPVNYWEVVVRARSAAGPPGVERAEALMNELRISIVPADADQGREAAQAAARFGRGTPAKLNLGDCFAYALAKREGEGLLFKGEDFPHTDIRSAL
ncbi:MAG: PilT protein domain protein [Caulobacter sp.]|nr:PilT protein domain protein [Caulobacter sp.]